MKKIEREKRVVELMIHIYCKKHHVQNDESRLCAECAQLLEYAHARLSHCRHGDKKGSCKKCAVHCYAPEQRQKIREVMKYVGPRMIFHHPWAAVRHLISEML